MKLTYEIFIILGYSDVMHALGLGLGVGLE